MQRKAEKKCAIMALLVLFFASAASGTSEPMKKTSATVQALSSLSTSSALPPGDWSQTYGGSGDDYAYSVVQTSDGGYAIAGYTDSSGAGSYDFCLVKTDSSGNTQWSKTYGGAGDDYAYSVVQTSDGGYAIAGYTSSAGAGYYDFYLVKTDSSGNTQWSKTYGGPGDDEAYRVIQTSDGGFALTGYTTSSAVDGREVWLVKTDSSGNMQWSRSYGTAGDNEAYSVVQTSDSGYALAGHTDSSGAGGDDLYLIKTNSTGSMQWNRAFGGVGDDEAYSVIQTSDGGYALAGYTGSVSVGVDYFWLVKTNSSGSEQWSQYYGSAGDSEAYSVVQTNDGGYALGGYTDATGAGGYDAWLVKTDSSGGVQWSQTYGDSSDDVAYSMIKTSDGGYALAGFTDSFGAGGFDFYLVKTDSAGASGASPTGGFNLNSTEGYVIIGAIAVIVASAALLFILSLRGKRKSSMNRYDGSRGNSYGPGYYNRQNIPPSDVCPRCGQRISQENVYCQKCGYKLR
jgi:hypothetical protein